MRLRIQHPLFAGFLGVIGLLVVLIVVLVGAGLRRELQTSVRGELERLLRLAEAIVSQTDGADPHRLARLVSDRIGYRVTFIARNGTVIADSSVEPADVPAIESHADRPEVRDLIDGEPLLEEILRTPAPCAFERRRRGGFHPVEPPEDE